MSDAPYPGPGSPRQKLAQFIPHRPKVGLVLSLLLALGFALLVTPVVLADRWADAHFVVGKPAPITVRVPQFSGFESAAHVIRGGSILVARGETITPATLDAIQAVRSSQPRGPLPFFAYLFVVFTVTALYTHHLRSSHRGRLLRVQAIHLGLVLAAVIAVKIVLLVTAASVLVVPVALFAIVPALVFDRSLGLATGIWASIVVSLLVPFDVGGTAVLVVQAAAAGLLLPERAKPRWGTAMVAGIVGGVIAALTYGIFHYLSAGAAPVGELSTPASSSWAAAGVGGLIAAMAAMPLMPLYQMAVGEITLGRVVALGELSHPLLKQIAERSPGTWQHSLAMANMAEIAANAIGANGRLVRIGAYFHDLGKSLQPKYFIENLEAGEQSPHDRLAPDVSCDAIFAHVTEGLAVARRNKLPERIIDFMHMHHGDGVLEYFWAKCRELGNPKGLTVADFRYPGVPPQSRETAILAICDAVEAASRTLKKPDDKAVESLVQRIVYGKLHLGQLDESGLSMADLRRISDSLRETIKHAHHGRIEYPWQREQAEADAQAATTPDTVAVRVPRAMTARGVDEPRLDSLDAPRAPWSPRARTSSESAAMNSGSITGPQELAIATTQVVSSPNLIAPSASQSQPTIAMPSASQSQPTLAMPSASQTQPTIPMPSQSQPTIAMPAPASTTAPTLVLPTAPMPAPAPSFAPPIEIPAPVATPILASPIALPLAAPPPITAAFAPPRYAMPTAPTAPTEPAPDPHAATQQLTIDAEPPVLLTVRAVDERAPTNQLPIARPSADDLDDVRGDADDASTRARSPRWTEGLAARIDLALTDDEPVISAPAIPIDDDAVISSRRRGPNTGEIAALSAAFVGAELRAATDVDETRVDAVPGDDAEPPAAPTRRHAAPPPARHTPASTPPPPPRSRRPVSTHEIDGDDDIEATIELQPHATLAPGGAIVGPPPATRGAPSQKIPILPGDDVSAQPPNSMMPPRVRTRTRPPHES